jgi:hypothetical protein
MRQSHRRHLLAIAVSIVLLGGLAPEAAAAGYVEQQITHVHWASAPSLAVDSSGHRHLAYAVVGSDPGIYYASDTAGTWVESRVSSDDGDRGPSIALDSTGRPSIAYGAAAGGVRLAQLDGSTWQIEPVSADAGGSEVSLAIDSANAPHIAMRLGVVPPYGAGTGLYHASRSGSDWTVEQLTSGEYDGSPSLAIDDADHLALAFVNGGDQAQFATNAGGSWNFSSIEGAGSGRHLSLALTSAGAPRVALEQNENSLAYASLVADVWSVESISSSAENSTRPSLSLDAADVPHVAYYDGSTGAASVASQTADGWTSAVVSENSVAELSLAIDPSVGRSVLAARSDDIALEQSGLFLFSDVTGGAWTKALVSANAVDLKSSAAVDQAGHHHVAFGRFGTAPGLYYGTDASGDWLTQRIVPGLILSVALAVGPTGIAHIAFELQDQTPNSETIHVDHATNSSGSWTVDQILQTGGFRVLRDIAVDASGRPHLAYSDQGGRRGTAIVESVLFGSRWRSRDVYTARAVDLPSIDIDPAGNVHIAAVAIDGLVYVTNARGGWKSELVDQTVPDFIQPSIVAGSDGTVTIAAMRWSQSELTILTRTGAGWSSQTVALPPGFDPNRERAPSLALDGAIREIAVEGMTNIQEVGIFRVSDRSGGFSIEQVASSLTEGDPSLFVEDGTVSIVFSRPAGLFLAKG